MMARFPMLEKVFVFKMAPTSAGVFARSEIIYSGGLRPVNPVGFS